MTIVELILIAIGLSMDAFAVSIGKGLASKEWSRKNQILTGVYFGGFQALMPILGFFVAVKFRNLVTSIDHFIAFGLLVLIGVQMVRESFSKEEELSEDSMAIKKMLILAIATSIDALAVGVSFAFLPNVNIWAAAGSIGIITFFLSAVGVWIGHAFGSHFKSKATLLGGLILIAMGCKILIEHLFF